MAVNPLPYILNAVLQGLNQKKQQEQQQALNQLLRQVFTQQVETPAVPATPDRTVQDTSIPFNPEAGINQQVNFPTRTIPGTPAQPATYREKSAMDMYSALLNHPLYNQIRPEQAQQAIKFITGVAPKPETAYQNQQIELARLRLEQREKEQLARDAQWEVDRKQDWAKYQGTMEFRAAREDRLAELGEQRNQLAERKVELQNQQSQANLERMYARDDITRKQVDDNWKRIASEIEQNNKQLQVMDENIKHTRAETAKLLKDMQEGSSLFPSYQAANKYILDNGMVGYIPTMTAKGQWKISPNLTSSLLLGNTGYVGITSPAANLQPQINKADIARTGTDKKTGRKVAQLKNGKVVYLDTGLEVK